MYIVPGMIEGDISGENILVLMVRNQVTMEMLRKTQGGVHIEGFENLQQEQGREQEIKDR